MAWRDEVRVLIGMATLAAEAESPAPKPNVGPVDSGRLAWNFVLLSAGEFLAKLLTLTNFMYLARVWGPARYGNFEFVLAVMIFFSLPTDLGLCYYAAREVAKQRSRASVLLQEIVALRVLLAISSFAALLIFVLVIHKSPEIKLALVLYGFSLFSTPALLQWFFQGHDGMQWVAAASITRQGVFTALVFLFARPHTPLVHIGLFECVSASATAAFCVYVMRSRLGFSIRRLRFPAQAFLGHLREAVPIGLSELLWALLWFAPTVMMGFMAPGPALGWFGAAHRGLTALHTFVWLYFFNLLPSISRCVALPGEHLLKLMRRSLTLVAWGGIFGAMVMSLMSRQLMTLPFGPSFVGAGGPFSLLVWIITVTLLSGHYRYTLIAYNQQKWLLYSTAVSAAVSVVLSWVLIPRFNAIGAASALMAAIVVNFALAYVCVRRFVVAIPCAGHLMQPLLVMTASLAVFAALARQDTWIATSAAALAYVSLFLAWQWRQLSRVCAQVLQKAPWGAPEQLRIK